MSVYVYVRAGERRREREVKRKEKQERKRDDTWTTALLLDLQTVEESKVQEGYGGVEESKALYCGHLDDDPLVGHMLNSADCSDVANFGYTGWREE